MTPALILIAAAIWAHAAATDGGGWGSVCAGISGICTALAFFVATTS